MIWSHCFLGEGVPPYWVWTQILRRLSTTRPDAFRAAAEPFGTLLAPLLPERADRPGGPAPESDWGRARFSPTTRSAKFCSPSPPSARSSCSWRTCTGPTPPPSTS